jgi:hypothetical protein
MVLPLATQGSRWRSLLGGSLIGAALIAGLAAAVVAASMLSGATLMLIISAGFDTPAPFLALVGALLAAVGSMAALVWAVGRFVLPALRRSVRTEADRLAVGVGVALAVGLGAVLMPEVITSTAAQLVTGQRASERVSLPTSDAERIRMRDTVRPAAAAGDPAAQFELALALKHGAAGEKRDPAEADTWLARSAAHPDGIDARLVLAVNLRDASADPRSSAPPHVALRIEALRRLRDGVAPSWRPAILGTMALLSSSYSGFTVAELPARDLTHDAGLAGSRAFAVLAAQRDEAVAMVHEGEANPTLADTAWRRAVEGYDAAGAIYEMQRLRDADLPERLRAALAPQLDLRLDSPGLQAAIDSPASATAPNAPAASAFGVSVAAPTASAPLAAGVSTRIDVALSQHLAHLAALLAADAVVERATDGERVLAAGLSLLAMERADHVSELARVNPAQRWTTDPFALGRWLKTLRHARGDCLAALEVSDTIRERRSFKGPRVEPTPRDMAWALAWAEEALSCATSDADRQKAQSAVASLDYIAHAAADLTAARAGVAASIAALR